MVSLLNWLNSTFIVHTIYIRHCTRDRNSSSIYKEHILRNVLETLTNPLSEDNYVLVEGLSISIKKFTCKDAFWGAEAQNQTGLIVRIVFKSKCSWEKILCLLYYFIYLFTLQIPCPVPPLRVLRSITPLLCL